MLMWKSQRKLKAKWVSLKASIFLRPGVEGSSETLARLRGLSNVPVEEAAVDPPALRLLPDNIRLLPRRLFT